MEDWRSWLTQQFAKLYIRKRCVGSSPTSSSIVYNNFNIPLATRIGVRDVTVNHGKCGFESHLTDNYFSQ